MIKLKELQASGGSYGADWIEPMDSVGSRLYKYKGRHKQITIPNNQQNKIKDYKGYRFLDFAVDAGYKAYTLYILMPDRDFVIGAIEYKIRDLGYFKNIKKSNYSSIHKRFRGKGLGKLLYEYFAVTAPYVASDDSLYQGSFRIWSEMDSVFRGTLFTVGQDENSGMETQDYYKKTTVNLSESGDRDFVINNCQFFVYVHKKSNIPPEIGDEEYEWDS